MDLLGAHHTDNVKDLVEYATSRSVKQLRMIEECFVSLSPCHCLTFFAEDFRMVSSALLRNEHPVSRIQEQTMDDKRTDVFFYMLLTHRVCGIQNCFHLFTFLALLIKSMAPVFFFFFLNILHGEGCSRKNESNNRLDPHRIFCSSHHEKSPTEHLSGAHLTTSTIS